MATRGWRLLRAHTRTRLTRCCDARWGKSGSGLTTPVRIEEINNGIALIFTPTRSNFVSFKEEKAAEKAREKGEEPGKETKRAVPKDAEGGIEVLCLALVTIPCLLPILGVLGVRFAVGSNSSTARRDDGRAILSSCFFPLSYFLFPLASFLFPLSSLGPDDYCACVCACRLWLRATLRHV